MWKCPHICVCIQRGLHPGDLYLGVGQTPTVTKKVGGMHPTGMLSSIQNMIIGKSEPLAFQRWKALLLRNYKVQITSYRHYVSIFSIQ